MLIVVGLLLLAFALRLQRLDQLPPGVFVDEGANGLDALKVLQGHHALFFPANLGREGLIMYADAFAIALLGRTIMAIRLPAALASVGTVLAFFGWVRFCSTNGAPRTQSHPGGACLSAPLPPGHWQFRSATLIMARNGWGANFLPLLLALGIGFLWSGMKGGSRSRVILAGLFTGLTAYTYLASRFTPVLLLALGLSFLWPAAVRPGNIRRHLPMVVLYLAVTGLVALPLVANYVLHPAYFSSRSSSLFIFDPAGQPRGSAGRAAR